LVNTHFNVLTLQSVNSVRKHHALRTYKCLCHVDVLQKNSQEIPEDGVDKRRNALS